MQYKYKLCDDPWDQSERNAIQRVIDSGRFSMGMEVQQYEKAFSEKFGCRYAVMVSSGSAANLLAVAALVYSGKLKKGDEVIVPAVSWSTTYFPLYQMGLKLRFVDIDRYTLNINVNSLREAITEDTKMLCLVNLLGNPNDFEQIIDICQSKNILVMEDNCESLGAEYQGRKAGTIGLIGTFSTFYSHHLCTMEGGVAVTDDEELYHYMLCIRAHGWTRNLPKDSKIYEKSENSFYESYNFIVPGFNIRPLEMEGAIGCEQLKKMDEIIMQRRKNAEYFVEQMTGISEVRTQKEIGKSSWFGFAVILEGRYQKKRERVVQKLDQAGIEVRPIVAGNFTRNPVVSYLDYTVYGKLDASDEIHENGFFIGNHSKDNKKDIDYFMQTFCDILSEVVEV